MANWLLRRALPALALTCLALLVYGLVRTKLLPSAARASRADGVQASTTGDMQEFEAPPGDVLKADVLFTRSSPAVVRVVVRDGMGNAISQGSGFFISAKGMVVTNHHVIRNGASVSVLLNNNAALGVRSVVATDQEGDLALLQVDGEGFPELKLAVETLPPIGAKVFAIGSPQGLTNTLSDGLVSGTREVEDDLILIQTTAAISPGSSGGPLLLDDGRVVGVTTLYLAQGQNLNFAVSAARIGRLFERSNDAPRVLVNSRNEGPSFWLARAMTEAALIRFGQGRAYFRVAARFAKLRDKVRCGEAVQRARAGRDEFDVTGSAVVWDDEIELEVLLPSPPTGFRILPSFDVGLVNVLARSGDTEGAEKLARSLPTSDARLDAFRAALETLREIGDQDAAQRFAHIVDDLDVQKMQAEPSSVRRRRESERALSAIFTSGGIDAVLDYVQQLRDTTDPKANIDDNSISLESWNAKSFAQGWVVSKAEDDSGLARMMPIAKEIFDDREREKAICVLARKLAEREQFESARVLADSLASPGFLAAAHTAIAQQLLKEGNVEQLRISFNKAAQAAKQIEDPGVASFAYLRLALCLADGRDFVSAYNMTSRISDVEGRQSSIESIAKIQAAAGQFAEAVRQARTIIDPISRAFLLEQIATEQARAGRFDDAFETIRWDDEVGIYWGRVLRQIAVEHAQAGRYSQARSIAETLMSPLAPQQAGVRGDIFDRIAAERAPGVGAALVRDDIYAAIAIAQAKAGLIKLAHESAAQVHNSHDRAPIYYTIVKASFSLHSLDEWKAWVPTLRTSGERFHAYLALADALMAGTNPRATEVDTGAVEHR